MLYQNRILLVDDEEQFIRLEERILKEQYVTRGVRSGTEALAEIGHFHPDLILLDIKMPDMDGYETCRRIRADDEGGLTKIFMVSAKAGVEERLAGYRAGADDYVTKPFDQAEFLAKVKTSLRLRRVEEIERMKSALLALMSTNVHQPTQHIINLAGDLIDAPETPGHLWKPLSHIFRSAVEFSHFAGKAARMYELQQGISLHPTVDPLRDHLNEVIRRWDPAIGHAGLKLSLICPENLLINADWRAIDEVFGYILDNAVRHAVSPSTISVTAIRHEDDCRIVVKNNGKGISPDLVETLFTPFSVDDIIHHHRGHGLSLSIAKALVTLHRGSVEVTSIPNEETVFTIIIPLKSKPRSKKKIKE